MNYPADFKKTMEQLPSLRDREEMIRILLSEEYGMKPPAADDVTFDVLSEESFGGGSAVLRLIRVAVSLCGGAFSFPLRVVLPRKKNAAQNPKKYKAIVHINFRPDVPDKYMPSEEISDRGYALASFCYKDVTTDDGDFSNGMAGVLYRNGQRNNPHDCGKIMMWAYAASLAADYLCTLPEIDSENLAVVGHSRLGKTALLAGALDERFRFVISNNSGCSGAAISRDKQGERIADICRVFPHWFAPRYADYAGREDQQPFDQHWLLAASAPRYVYVASASEDAWADPYAEFAACRAAAKAWESAGMAGFIAEKTPLSGDVFHDGCIGYHLREGEHYLGRYDWNRFMDFIDSKTANESVGT